VPATADPKPMWPSEGDYFYTNEISNDGDFINRHANFRSLGFSALTLVRCATGESFNGIMHDAMDETWGSNRLRCCPTCGPVVDGKALSSCGSGYSIISIIIFTLFTICMGFIILNGLFIGVIVDNFTNIGSENKEITIESIEEFREVWLRYDPRGTFVIPSHSLLSIIQELKRPLGINDVHPTPSRAEMLKILGNLNVPDHGGFIHFMETLTALSHAVCGCPVPLCDTTKRIYKSVAKTPGLKTMPPATDNALTNYLVSLLQSRWRGYAMRKKYSDNPDEAPPVPAVLNNDEDPHQSKVKGNQVMPAP